MENENYILLQTKVSKSAAEKLYRLCKQRGMKPYKFLQMMCDTIIRYTDDQHNLSEEMERAMGIFEHMVGWADTINLADPDVKMEISQAVYVFEDAEHKRNNKRTGFRVTMVDRPFMGEWTETQNVNAIFERMVEVLLPELYRKLRYAAAELDCKSIAEALSVLADADILMKLEDEFRKSFADDARADNRRSVVYGHKTKRKHKADPDSIAMDNRRKDTQMEIDFEPIGGEW